MGFKATQLLLRFKRIVQEQKIAVLFLRACSVGVTLIVSFLWIAPTIVHNIFFLLATDCNWIQFVSQEHSLLIIFIY
jgi:hypothetical protein